MRERTDVVPKLGIVLGSGLGSLADELEDAVAIPFAELPGWPAASAPGHAGRLLFGKLEGLPVVCLQGRLHLYEGHPARLVVEPVLLMGRLGAPRVLLTNAAGGVNAAYPAGTLMIINDHINMTGQQPLIGPNDDAIGPRFPDLVDVWSPPLRALMQRAAAATGVAVEEGVYVGLTGPSYETPAEVRMLRGWGADAVGMSTVLEAIMARWAGIEVVGVSLVTNPGAGVTGLPLSHEEVLAAGEEAGPGSASSCAASSVSFAMSGADADKLVVSWDDLDALVGSLAERVGSEYDVVLCITRGGLVPAGMLAYRLGFRNILVAAVAFYDDAGQPAEQPTFFQFPADPLLHDRRVLVVDEVWDTGTTIAAVVERVHLAGGRPTTAVLHYKPKRSRVEIVPDYYAVETDGWVVYPFKYGK